VVRPRAGWRHFQQSGASWEGPRSTDQARTDEAGRCPQRQKFGVFVLSGGAAAAFTEVEARQRAPQQASGPLPLKCSARGSTRLSPSAPLEGPCPSSPCKAARRRVSRATLCERKQLLGRTAGSRPHRDLGRGECSHAWTVAVPLPDSPAIFAPFKATVPGNLQKAVNTDQPL
jgi:hypothetical protein